MTSQNQRQPANADEVQLGDAIRYVRQRLGLSQRKAAHEVGISHIHLSNLENRKVAPTTTMIEKFFNTWGIDLYMVAVAKFSSKRRIPPALEAPVSALAAAWDEEIDALIDSRRTESDTSCSEFND